MSKDVIDAMSSQIHKVTPKWLFQDTCQLFKIAAVGLRTVAPDSVRCQKFWRDKLVTWQTDVTCEADLTELTELTSRSADFI